jgi:methyl-accepting chemotaxis protein
MFSRMTIRVKILVSFLFLATATVIVGGFGLSAIGQLSAQTVELSQGAVPSLEGLGHGLEGFTAMRFHTTQGLVAALQANEPGIEMAFAKREEARQRSEKGLAQYAAIPMDKDEKAAWDRVEPAFRAFVSENEKMWNLIRGHDAPGATKLQAAITARFQQELVEPLESLAKLQEDQAVESQKAADASSAGTRSLLWTVIAIAVAAAVGLTFVLTRALTVPLKVLASEAAQLRDAVVSGRLSTRGDLAKVGAEFRPIIEGINETMDAFARPIAVTADYVTRISNGDIPPKITDHYEGDFNGIKDALNRCIDSLSGLTGEMNRMSGEHDKGDIDAAVDTRKFEGAYRTMAQGVNDMVGAHIAVKKKAMAIFAEFGKGNFDATLEQLPGKKRFINDAIDQVRKNLKDLIAELDRMSGAHDAGDIDAVIEAQRFHGAYRTMAEGVNNMVAGHIAVKKKAMACVAEFGRGNFEAPLEKFPGKKAFINETIEQVRVSLKALIADADGLVQAAVAGQLSTRADASRHLGDFRKIVDGVNKTLDAVMAPINEAAEVLEQLSQRDLRARVTGQYQGDHAKIKESVNSTAEALHDALAQVAQAVDQVSSASTQIAASSQAVASGASEQASALQETTSSIESVSSMTKQTADSAQQANQLAKTARLAATDGSAAVEQMQGAMGRIKASAEGTSQIIKDINDIAFQTNLLALNAAVEAARAGEAGRGFAVVAEEVRSLALRAKEAATKTEELIRQSVKEAGEGEVTAKHVAGKLGEIATGVSKVSDIVAEIASSAQAQSAGIEQVTGAVSEMDKVTQQNAASAEESSSAASELSGQAEELAAMVAAFQLATQARTNAAVAARRALSLPAPSAAPQARNSARSSRRASPAVPRGVRNDDAPQVKAGGQAPRAVPLRADDAFPMDEQSEVRDF